MIYAIEIKNLTLYVFVKCKFCVFIYFPYTWGPLKKGWLKPQGSNLE